jgi:hypothetical protein
MRVGAKEIERLGLSAFPALANIEALRHAAPRK